MKWKPLTSYGGVHPGEGDTANDTFTEAQQERASLFFLQEGLLFAFAHETHNEATVQMGNRIQTQNYSVSRELMTWAQLLNSDLNPNLTMFSILYILISPQVFKIRFHHHQDAIKPRPESVRSVFLQQNR